MVRGREIWAVGAAGVRRARGATAALATPALLATALVLATAAQANTESIVAPSPTHEPTVDNGWQAGTCKSETPTCSVDTPTQFFEQASGHPQFGFTQIIVRQKAPGKTPVGELKTVRVDLPVGLTVNPQATPQCSQTAFEASTCPAGSAVGESLVYGSVLGTEVPEHLKATVYNIVPKEGESARFGFNLAGNNVYLEGDVAWDSDYHEGFTIHVPPLPFSKLPPLSELLGGLILKNRLVFKGRSGNGTFITTPTTCLGPAEGTFEHTYSTWLLASSVEEEEEAGYQFPQSARPPLESPIPEPTFPKECDSIPFAPSIGVDPNTDETDSPSGAAVNVEVPFEVPEPEEIDDELTKQGSSHVRTAEVTLPEGMGLNPSAANGLVACTDAQFGKGTSNPVACPAASKIGTVVVETPPLEEPAAGDVYLGEQHSRDPLSGEEFRIFVDAESQRYGISARLIGHTAADPQTGQLTTTFPDNPQVPFTSFLLHFNEGATAALTSPPTCGPHGTSSSMTPWSSTQGSIPGGQVGGPNTDPPAAPSDEFSLTSAPGGGPCAKGLGERPFKPGFAAKTDNPQAGAFSPLHLGLTRADGEQELKGATVALPSGVTAKLAGVTYCPESALSAAAANSGVAEAASSSCPASSLIGSASVLSGSGPSPIRINGKAFLTGPYNGAPLSLAVVTPATAGPFDLGSVVVRVALFVDPETAKITAISDPVPHIFGGVKLDIRSIDVDMDRPQFSLNPTNCSPMTVGATLFGGGSNPADTSAFTQFSASAPFQVSGCDALGFAPKLFLRTFGATRRAKNPKLQAVFVTRPGDANPAKVAVTLPKSIILDQSSISKVCTRVQFAAHSCPSDSVYGFAKAFTPLLEAPLEGPVYLRSSNNTLPDLVAALHGQVDVVLVGRTDSVKGRIRNTFESVPDVPVSKFVLTVRGGKTGLLVNSRNLCPKPRRHHGHTRHHKRKRRPLLAVAKITGQNGKAANQKPKVRTPCGKKHSSRHRHHHH